MKRQLFHLGDKFWDAMCLVVGYDPDIFDKINLMMMLVGKKCFPQNTKWAN
jgi:hypothetical protein